jgi:hypothetical protein
LAEAFKFCDHERQQGLGKRCFSRICSNPERQSSLFSAKSGASAGAGSVARRARIRQTLFRQADGRTVNGLNKPGDFSLKNDFLLDKRFRTAVDRKRLRFVGLALAHSCLYLPIPEAGT